MSTGCARPTSCSCSPPDETDTDDTYQHSLDWLEHWTQRLAVTVARLADQNNIAGRPYMEAEAKQRLNIAEITAQVLARCADV